MNQMNGVAIVDMTQNQTKSIFFDREVVEFAQMNAAIKRNRAKAHEKEKAAERKRMEMVKANRKEQKKMFRWRVYTVKTFISVISCLFVVVGIMLSMFANLVDAVLAIPLAALFFAVACIKFGAWFGRATSKR